MQEIKEYINRDPPSLLNLVCHVVVSGLVGEKRTNISENESKLLLLLKLLNMDDPDTTTNYAALCISKILLKDIFISINGAKEAFLTFTLANSKFSLCVDHVFSQWSTAGAVKGVTKLPLPGP